MAATKDKTGTWTVNFYYENFEGVRKKKHKRGFKTKREANEWERDFLQSIHYNPEIKFENLLMMYLRDMKPRLKQTTLENKKYLLEKQILPFFKTRKVCDITPILVRRWQNKLLEKNYSQTYLKTINNQLVALLNYAVRYHGLGSNPCHKAGSIGKKESGRMDIWTPAEFNKFVELLKHKDTYVGFQVLFWTGVRIGELLALTVGDIDFEKNKLTINKSYQRFHGKDLITTPKTEKSNRVILIPGFLVKMLKDHIDRLYKPTQNTRLFNHTKHAFEHDIRIYSEKAQLKKIRIHDLRHSHASFLFSKDIDVLSISKRLGHEKIETTLNVYTHLYKSHETKLFEVLNNG